MGQQTVGKYRILDRIASGTQGAVFRAFDPESQRIVALKVLHSSLIQDATYIERFHREATLTASVDHPNVVVIYEVGSDGDQHYIALEFLPESLHGLIESGALPVANAAGLAAGIADGLGAVHKLGIVHRDMKPQNVLITPDGTPKVTDFGIARGEALPTMTATGMIMGTPYYMSPEQAEGHRVDASTDVYALGCVLYQMLSGEVPFSGDTPFSVIRKHLEQEPRPIRTLRRDIPRPLADVIAKAMSKSPDDRYADGAEMAQAIRAAVPGIRSVAVTPPRAATGTADLPSPTDPPTAQPIAPPRSRPPLSARTIAYISGRSRTSQLFLMVTAAAIVAIVAALATVIALSGGNGSPRSSAPVAAPTATPTSPAPTATTIPSVPTATPASPAPTATAVPTVAVASVPIPTIAVRLTPSPTMPPSSASPTTTPQPAPGPLPTPTPEPRPTPTPTPTSIPSPTSLPTPTPAPKIKSLSVWRPTESMAGPRRDHAAVLLDDGTVLIVGGTSATAELYTTDIGGFGSLGNVPFSQGVRAIKLSDGRVLVAGRFEGTTAMIYDPASRQFTATGSLNIAREYSSVTLLPDGKVLVAGGQERVDGGPQTLAAAEVYDPATGIFTLTESLNEHRSGHAAVLLPNGKVLIVGGTQTTTPGFGVTLTAAELYDPASGTFSVIGNTISAHSNLSIGGITLLPTGKVLIAGGAGNKVELFDPATGTFSVTGNLTTTRSVHSSTLLPNGQVLLVGGSTAGGPVVTNSAELYDPVSGTFSPIAGMAQPRQQHTATLLPNGNVLVIGGFDGVSDLSAAELWILESALTPAPIRVDPLELAFVGTEPREAGVVYQLSVINWSTVPEELFMAAPHLPPCGSNNNSARTWVGVYDADSDALLERWCTFKKPSDLQVLGFFVPTGGEPPARVRVELEDRETGQVSVSSTAHIPTPAGPTPTPTPFIPPTPEPTAFPLPPGVIAMGLIELSPLDAVDFDEGKLVPGNDEADIGFEVIGSGERLIFPYAGAGIALIGSVPPGLATCRSAIHSPGAINISQTPVGTYFCVITREGNTTEIKLVTNVPAPGPYLQFTYTTWSP